MKKKRILITSFTIPENRMGGGLLLYRHFVERTEYEIGILSNNRAEPPPEVFHRFIPEPKLVSRLKRTRASKWAHDYANLVQPYLGGASLIREARQFSPDLIFNVAETYFSNQALALARKLKVPFACYFMDWANYASTQHAWAVPLMDRAYRRLYRQSDLALCISEGMKDELGPHDNVRVVYPIAAQKHLGPVPQGCLNQKYTFCFAGNLAHWYGHQIAALMERVSATDSLHLDVFGAYHQWTTEFEAHYRRLGFYHGFRPFDDLSPEFQSTDAFLLTMGFGDDARLIESTSFKTKLLDYLQFGKPVLIWGPEYCTAVRVAKEYDSAVCVTDPNPDAALTAMKALEGNEIMRERLVKNAARMREELFDPDSVHTLLVSAIDSVIRLANSNERKGGPST